MALDWVWAFGSLPFILAAGMCIALGVGIGPKYLLSRQASFASLTLLGVGATGLGLAALVFLAVLLLQ